MEGETHRAVFIREVSSQSPNSTDFVLSIFDFSHTIGIQIHIDYERGEARVVRCSHMLNSMEYPAETGTQEPQEQQAPIPPAIMGLIQGAINQRS